MTRLTTCDPVTGDEAVWIRVVGRVQGVGFRDYTRREGTRLGLAGWVRNLPDGGVETRARGPRADLEAFIAAVQRGPSSGRVDDCHVDWINLDETLEGFSIRW